MTDRVNGFIVTLDKPYREDDIEELRKAILMLKGVVSCESQINTHADEMVRIQVAQEFINKLLNFIKNNF